MAATNAGNLSVTITGVDRLSGQLARIGGNLNRFGAQTDRLSARMSRGLNLDRVADSAKLVSRNLASIVPPLAAITGAGSAAGIVALTDRWARFNATLERGAVRTRTGVSQYQALGNAARLAGSSAEDMQSGLAGLSTTLTDAAGGRNQTAVSYLQSFGIGLRDAAGNARAAVDVLPELADIIQRLRDQPDLQLRVMDNFGLPPGLLPLLSQGSDKMRELVAEARRLGVTSEGGAGSAFQFEQAMNRLNLAGETLTRTIGERLGPSLTPVLDGLTNWSTDNAPGIAGGLDRIGTALASLAFPKGFVQELDGGLRSVDALARRIESFADSPIGRWWFDRETGGERRGTPWSLMGPIGTLDDQAAQQERDAAKAPSVAAGAQWSQGWGALQSIIQRMLGNPLESRIQAIPGGPTAGFPNRAGREAQRIVEPGPAPTDLLGLIGRSEGTDRRRGYNETLGYGAFTGGDRNLTGMTLEEVDRMQSEMLRHSGNTLNSSAAGRYQITQTTLRGLVHELGIDPKTARYDEGMQDRLATALAERRGLRAYEAGRISKSEFQQRLSQEWASIPDPRTGQGFYPGQRRPGVDQGMVDRVLEAQRRPGASRAPEPAAAVSALPERGEEPMRNPSVRNASDGGAPERIVKSVVELRFENPPQGLVATTRGEDGGVRIQRPALGVTP